MTAPTAAEIREPWRTCVGCRAKLPKSALLRVVHSAEAGLRLDRRQRLPGRGAYLCRDERCWRQGVARRSIDHTLRASVAQAERDAFLAALATMRDEEEK